MNGRILWLAVADARGHLFRAHLMRKLLVSSGIEVEIVTTKDEGVAFLRSLGTPSFLLSRSYYLEYDERQNMSHLGTEARIARYLMNPKGCVQDLRRLERLSIGSDLIVNDSFHPAALLGALWSRRLQVVNVYGRSMHQAVFGYCQENGRRVIDEVYQRLLRASLVRSLACVEHTLTPRRTPRGTFSLLPVISAPTRSREEVRAALQLPPEKPLAVVYLNPHFRSLEVAEALEAALTERGFAYYAVGEGLSHRPRWRARDENLSEIIAASDLLVAAPGMASLGQAMSFGVPMLALSTDQPEQQHNLSMLANTAHPHAIVAINGSYERLLQKCRRALNSLPKREPASSAIARVQEIQKQWVQVFTTLTFTAQRFSRHHLALA